jgi:type I restriction enzyme S subunit
MSANNSVKWVKLGELIELCDERNVDEKYTLDDVRGISIQKKLISTKADMKDVSLAPYKLLHPREFSYVTVTSRNGEKISLAMNDTSETYIVSSSYINFRSKDNNILLPEYLYLLLSREEFDRYSRFNSWGSARETFDWSEMCRVEIPLPSIEVQRELVNVYNGLKALVEQNEALVEPLSKACEAFIVNCKKQYPFVKLGEYIEESTVKNNNFEYKKVLGLSTKKEFREPNSRVNKNELATYKIVHKNYFAYVPTTDTWKVFACALNKEETIVVSPIYCVFRVIKDNLLPEYLEIILSLHSIFITKPFVKFLNVLFIDFALILIAPDIS